MRPRAATFMAARSATFVALRAAIQSPLVAALAATTPTPLVLAFVTTCRSALVAFLASAALVTNVTTAAPMRRPGRCRGAPRSPPAGGAPAAFPVATGVP